jgi:hypothetical protein
MKLEVHLSIGYPTADCEDTLDIPDEELEGLNEAEKEELFNTYLQEWADNYIETWWKEV